jgi:hypothetical protein
MPRQTKLARRCVPQQVDLFAAEPQTTTGGMPAVELSQTERAQLMQLLSGGRDGARKLKRTQVLLAADGGASDGGIARSVGSAGPSRTSRL